MKLNGSGCAVCPVDFEADVIVIGFGGAGGCAAIEAHDRGVKALILEKQPQDRHYSNTRMSGGGYHSPDPEGDPAALREYAKAMFSGENLPWKYEGAQPDYSDELAQVWADYAPQNEAFLRSLDPDYKTIKLSSAAYPQFPGARESKYAVVRSSYTGNHDEASMFSSTRDMQKSEKEAGEAFHACILHGVQVRGIDIHYDTRAEDFILNEAGEVVGVLAESGGKPVRYIARRAVVVTSGGYEYNRTMRNAFLEGPGPDSWAFYSSIANTGDGIEMGLRVGAALTKVSTVSARMICAIPVREHGLRIGLNTSSVGKPNELVVDNYGNRYSNERRITKDPSSYIFYKEGIQFDTDKLSYPRIPSWMIFDETLRRAGPIVRVAASAYNMIIWPHDNLEPVKKGWILTGGSIEELAEAIRRHPDNVEVMNQDTLIKTVNRYNAFCEQGEDLDFGREKATLGPVKTPPFYAIPLYPGGPNTKGGLLANAKRQVLDWRLKPIPRLYTAGEISSAFQFLYSGGGNLAECIVFGRLAGKNAAAENLWK